MTNKYHVFYSDGSGKERQFTVPAERHELVVTGNGYHQRLALFDAEDNEVASFRDFKGFVRTKGKPVAAEAVTHDFTVEAST